MKLYGDHRSGNCYKVAWLLTALSRPYEWIETNALNGETRSGDFLRRNPNGKVPLLELPDGRCLAESNAMLLHFAEGTPWLPVDDYERATTYSWLFFEQYSHEPYVAVARSLVYLQGKAEQERERLEMLHAKGNEALGVMEGQLLQKRFFGGSTPSIADIALYAYTHRAEDGLFRLDPYPAVRGWLARLEKHSDYHPMDRVCR